MQSSPTPLAPSGSDRRRFLGLTASTALLPVSLPALAQPGNPHTLKVVAPWEVMNLDPSKTGHVFLRLEVAETLVDVNEQGLLAPGLAQSWSHSDNGLLWRFGLRPGARFHDGSAVTGQAVAGCLQRALEQPGVLRNTGIEKVQAQGTDVVFTLARPFAALPAFLAHSSALVLAPASFAGDGSVKALIGSGPYQVMQVNAPQSMRVRRFGGYDGKKPAIEAIEYLAAGRGETRGMLASSGQADLVFTHDPVSYARLRQNRKLRFETQPLPRTIYIKVNAGHRFLSDVRVRQAMSLSIDRLGIAGAILRAPQAAATQLFPPVMAEWHVAGLQALPHNVDQAKRLLGEVGWQAGADGLLRKGGEVFKVTMRTFSDRPELPPIATAIQAQFKAVGIDMAVAIGNASEIPAGHQDGSLELALLARNYGLVPDPIGSLLQDFGPRGGDWGAMAWQSTQVSQTLAQMSAMVDPRRRSAMRGSVATVLQAELPVIPVAWYQHSVTASTRLHNVSVDPLERSYRISRMVWGA